MGLKIPNNHAVLPEYLVFHDRVSIYIKGCFVINRFVCFVDLRSMLKNWLNLWLFGKMVGYGIFFIEKLNICYVNKGAFVSQSVNANLIISI